MDKNLSKNEIRNLSNLASGFLFKNPPLPMTQEGSVPYLLWSIDNHLTTQHVSNKLMLPSFSGLGNLCVFSDYAGDHKRYRSYVFLFTAFGVVEKFIDEALNFRKKFHLRNSDFQFKKPRNSAAKYSAEFVELFGKMPCLAVTILIDKHLPSVFAKDRSELKEQLVASGVTEKHTKVSERILLISSVIGYFTALLKQDINGMFWQSDRDKSLDKEERVQLMFRQMTGLWEYFGVEFEPFGYAMPFDGDDEETRGFNDIISIPDIIAGSLTSAFEGYDSSVPSTKLKKGRFKNPYVQPIVDLFSGQRVGFRHLTFLASKSADDQLPSITLANIANPSLKQQEIII